VFPRDIGERPYSRKWILRFGDSATQMIVVAYPPDHPSVRERCEITRYSLAGMSARAFHDFIAEAEARDSNMTAKALAAKLRIESVRIPFDLESLNRALSALREVRISPLLADRFVVDSSEYEYWYDTWGESVHYTLLGPSHDPPGDLVSWMIAFRSQINDLLKPSRRGSPPSR
jgi:hypothetical protein